MSEAASLYIGLMSGTSADSIDAALVEFNGDTPRLVAALGIPYDKSIRKKIFELALPSDNEIDRMGVLDRHLGTLFARAVNRLLEENGYSATQITAIGSHGQTIRHRPRAQSIQEQFTLQIGDPNSIAELTGITTVADFRRRDMAAGGQGAPLAPAFHQAVFSSKTEPRCILNIGGVANLTFLPTDGHALGFDTGPGNSLMDSWIQTFGKQQYDKNGKWAASGQVNLQLLNKLLAHSFFRMPAPKSTGKEDFNLDWVNSATEETVTPLTPQDVQATLTELTAITISDAIKGFCAANTTVFICGGGVHNTHLCNRIQYHLPENRVSTTDELNLHPDWVEAVAFAWLAKRTIGRLAGNLPEVTGADREVVLGGIYSA
ncbi:anhydro-N-acetylmuramic acid kinase [Teredinibacter waterburyi]|jgi:Predicted molecular chaperone distantly related to HSP70-fold metalloproteases|uniref:anhydro-N-acetylmuramic acid kinase n=1 Tax=Teredinibacter waterburyi TaxID=1500538 RepID=UPI00165F7B36|nr:anhydro-N-acetylmuramic acid kinase [Teredinibacter waterburyi]